MRAPALLKGDVPDVTDGRIVTIPTNFTIPTN
jgi:hypothetical protein